MGEPAPFLSLDVHTYRRSVTPPSTFYYVYVQYIPPTSCSPTHGHIPAGSAEVGMRWCHTRMDACRRLELTSQPLTSKTQAHSLPWRTKREQGRKRHRLCNRASFFRFKIDRVLPACQAGMDTQCPATQVLGRDNVTLEKGMPFRDSAACDTRPTDWWREFRPIRRA